MDDPARDVARAETGDAIYRFRIDAYTPDTIPMARLGEYMTQLAAMLGEPASVHFAGLEKGSTVLVQRVAREAVPKVQYRTDAIRRGEAPRDAQRAYHAINKLLREDNGAGTLAEPTGGAVLAFPGRSAGQDPATAVRQVGTVDGRLIRVGGTDKLVPILLEVEGEPITRCLADRAVAKRLGRHLFEYVRLSGTGRWRRDPGGQWTLHAFRVAGFRVLGEGDFAGIVESLREVAGGVDPGAYEELDLIRHGTSEEPDGRP